MFHFALYRWVINTKRAIFKHGSDFHLISWENVSRELSISLNLVHFIA